MGKRTSSTTETAAAVKMAKVDPRETKCQDVISALRQCQDLPAAACDMLCEMTPFSMKPWPNERHDFHWAAVALVGAELEKLEKCLAAEVEKAEEKRAELGREKESREARVAELAPKLEEQQAQTQTAKHALAAHASAFRNAKEALAEAVGELRAGGEAVAAAQSKHSKLEATMAELAVLRDGQLDPAGVPEAVSAVVLRLQQFFQVEESLLTAVPSALAKEPASRGAFDTMSIAQFEEQARKHLEALAAETKGAATAEAQRAEAVKAAEEALAATRGPQRSSAEAFTAMSRCKDECEAALQDAKHWLRNVGRLESFKLEKVLGQAQGALQEFRDGPLATFRELRDINAPAPPSHEADKAVSDEAEATDAPKAAAGGA